MTTSSFAAGAYASMQGIGAGGLLKKPASVGTAGAAGMPDFSSLLGKALDFTLRVGRAPGIAADARFVRARVHRTLEVLGRLAQRMQD